MPALRTGMGWGWDGMGWDGMGWDGMGWDGILYYVTMYMYYSASKVYV